MFIKPSPLACLGDAAITLVLLICVLAGVRLEWVFGVYLVFEIMTHLGKALHAFLTSTSESVSVHGPS